MKCIRPVILALSIAFFCSIAYAGDIPAEDWPMFNHDPARTCMTSNQAAPPFLTRTAYMATAAIHSSMAMTERYSVVGCDDGKIYCYETHSGRIRWSFLTKAKVRCSPTISEQVVVCGSDDGYMYCFNLDSGALVWSYKTNDLIRSSPVVVKGRVYFASRDMKVYCIDIYTGEKVWAFHTGAFVDAAPTYSEKGKLIIVGSYSKKMYALSADTGRLVWEYQTEAEVYAACSVAGDKLFFGDDKGFLYCLGSDGKQVWKKDMSGAHIWSTPALIDDKIIIPTGYNKKVYCLYQDSGDVVWEFTTENWNYSSPAIGGKYVYFGSDDQYLYCLNWRTGQEVWKGNLGYIIEASPVIYDEAIYVGTWGGTVEVFQPGPILEVEPLEIDYGTVELGSTPFKDFIVRNKRNDQFITKLEGKIETDETHLSFNYTQFSEIQNGSQITIRMTLDPAGMQFGNHQALLNISSNGGGYTMVVRWNVVTPALPCMKVSPTELNFGYINRGDEISKTVTLSFDTEEEVTGIVMGEDRWIDVEPVTFTSVNKKFLLKVTVSASRIPAGIEAVGKIVIATKNDVCQQVSVAVKVETEPRIELFMTIGDKIALVNGRQLEMEVGPYVTPNGRSMVPLRFISEIFGAKLQWFPTNKEIRIERFDQKLVLWIGRPQMDVNGVVKPIPAPPEIKDSRTMVPFRAISEGFGADVQWIPETKTVKMVYNP